MDEAHWDWINYALLDMLFDEWHISRLHGTWSLNGGDVGVTQIWSRI